jgi:hypothetical protein
MANPWDAPPLPDHGDDDIERTFAGVGRVLSQWETIEIELSVLYALFTKRPADAEARREYGKGRIFVDRSKIIEDVAPKWLCNQELEAEFDSLICTIRHYSDRRNEIAHGIVRPIQWVIPFEPRSRFQYCLSPPYHDYRRYTEKDLPEYIYIYDIMIELERKLFVLAGDITKYRVARLLSLQRP